MLPACHSTILDTLGSLLCILYIFVLWKWKQGRYFGLFMMKIWDLPKSEEDAVSFLQAEKILPAECICEKGHKMKLYFGERIQWCCNIRSCRSKVNMRVGNWFMGSRLPFVTALHFIYCWSEEMTSIDWCH